MGERTSPTLVIETPTPVGSGLLLSAPSPAGLIRCQRIRPPEHLISSSVPEPRWQQALPLDRGVDHFGSAFFTRPSTPEKLAHQFGSALVLQHSIPRPARGALPGSTFAPLCSLPQSLLTAPVFERICQLASTVGFITCSIKGKGRYTLFMMPLCPGRCRSVVRSDCH